MEPNWQPGPEMLALMEALANESGDVFRMKRRDYLYLTAELQLHHIILSAIAERTVRDQAGRIRCSELSRYTGDEYTKNLRWEQKGYCP